MTDKNLVQSRQATIIFPFFPHPDPRHHVSGTARRGMCLELELNDASVKRQGCGQTQGGVL